MTVAGGDIDSIVHKGADKALNFIASKVPGGKYIKDAMKVGDFIGNLIWTHHRKEEVKRAMRGFKGATPKQRLAIVFGMLNQIVLAGQRNAPGDPMAYVKQYFIDAGAKPNVYFPLSALDTDIASFSPDWRSMAAPWMNDNQAAITIVYDLFNDSSCALSQVGLDMSWLPTPPELTSDEEREAETVAHERIVGVQHSIEKKEAAELEKKNDVLRKLAEKKAMIREKRARENVREPPTGWKQRMSEDTPQAQLLNSIIEHEHYRKMSHRQ
jgi:hypothetical protein